MNSQRVNLTDCYISILALEVLKNVLLIGVGINMTIEYF